MLATGKIFFSAASGLMVRPSLSLYFLMYTLSFFGAKIPTPFFFMASAFFLPAAFIAFLPAAFFVALIAAFVAFVMVVFVVVTVVVVVIAIEGWKCTHA